MTIFLSPRSTISWAVTAPARPDPTARTSGLPSIAKYHGRHNLSVVLSPSGCNVSQYIQCTPLIISVLCKYALFDRWVAWDCGSFHYLWHAATETGRNSAYHPFRFSQHFLAEKLRPEVGGDTGRNSLDHNPFVTRCLGRCVLAYLLINDTDRKTSIPFLTSFLRHVHVLNQFIVSFDQGHWHGNADECLLSQFVEHLQVLTCFFCAFDCQNSDQQISSFAFKLPCFIWCPCFPSVYSNVLIDNIQRGINFSVSSQICYITRIILIRVSVFSIDNISTDRWNRWKSPIISRIFLEVLNTARSSTIAHPWKRSESEVFWDGFHF
jgi:hypothetical protein